MSPAAAGICATISPEPLTQLSSRKWGLWLWLWMGRSSAGLRPPLPVGDVYSPALRLPRTTALSIADVGRLTGNLPVVGPELCPPAGGGGGLFTAC